MDRKLRAVVDTNLFISGIFGQESLFVKLQDLWIEQEFELATSMEILKEVSRLSTCGSPARQAPEASVLYGGTPWDACTGGAGV